MSHTVEQQELRRVVRRFCQDKSSSADVRRAIRADSTRDAETWQQMASQLGLQGIAIPERHGGAGGGLSELVIVLEEMGRALLVSPYFATVALAAQLIDRLGDDRTSATYLPRIADGTLTATVALAEERGSWELESLTTAAHEVDGAWQLSGVKSFVIDADSADLVLVVARTSDGLGVFALEGDGPGITRTRLESFDLTRRLGRIELDGAHAERIGPDGDATEGLRSAVEMMLVALGAEQTGGAARCLDMSVEYAKIRSQFGRPIGSFQAIKHKAADMLLQVESASAAVHHAAGVVGASGQQSAIWAALVKSCCSEAFTHVAKENVQIHGGIGFTWEHDAHLYLRRAKADAQHFGAPGLHRRGLADLVLGAEPAEAASETLTHGPARELRAYLDRVVPEYQARWGSDTSFPARRAWHQILAAGGWAAPSWPVEHGGRGLEVTERVACDAVLSRFDGPMAAGVFGLQNVGPALIMFGTAAQQESLPRILDGTEIWVQGFSEPGAGSDLASLSTRADPVPGGFTVNGQKIWTSDGVDATHAMVLVRTDREARKHRGITALLVDLSSQGIERRVITQISGDGGFCEMFFTDVFVPAENVLGEVHDGWHVTTKTLGYERTGVINLASALEREVLRAVSKVEVTDPLLRDELVRRWMEARLVGVMGARALAGLADGQAPGAEQSIIKFGWSLCTSRLGETLMDIAGADALLVGEPASQRFLRSRSSTIAAGTTEVLRNILAERVLGLPREPEGRA